VVAVEIVPGIDGNFCPKAPDEVAAGFRRVEDLASILCCWRNDASATGRFAAM
jgi:hypothetical protein